MPGRVESPKEILLNSVPYRIKGRVQNSLASPFPRKTVSGDVQGDDQQRGANPAQPGLAQIASVTTASGALGSFAVGVIGELGSEVYGAFGTDVRKFNNATD